ncbi:MAG: TonB-dependent receptor [Bacteroidia bacterium]|nr:TonB-dependent receptor [Bacteroidia bacterium]
MSDSANGEPLIGVIVSAGEKQGAVTDISGNYLLRLEPGSYTLTFRYTGYTTQTAGVTLAPGENKQLDMKLVNATQQLNLVVVSAGRYEQKITDVTVSMEVIKPALIENKNTTNMETIIDQTPGVNVTDGQANIRGGSGFSYGAGSRVLMVVDDMPMLSGDAGDVKWNFLPVENVSQVEVLKGASSALFGSSALNGVIHFRTAYPGLKPQTNVTIFSGFYDSPQRQELKWWKNTPPANTGLSFNHSRQIGNLDLVVGGNFFDDDGYRYLETEQRARLNINTRYRFKKIPGLSAGINANMMRTTGGLFILWYNDTLGYIPADSTVQNYINKRFNIDPFITYYGPKGHRHALRTRFFRTDNANDLAQSSLADLWYGEYQYQYRFKNDIAFTAGLVGMYSSIKSQLYKDHYSTNIAGYIQTDKRFFDKLTVSAGLRAEYFRVDTASTEYVITRSGTDTISLPFRPVFRFGVNYQLLKATFIRASYGQGYRFPSIAEKFVRTSASSLEIYPNAQLQPETGQSAELGVKQGLAVANWKGYADLSVFWMEYRNMMEFTFGQWGNPLVDPLFGLGFKSINIGSTRTTGFDFSVMGQGQIGNSSLTLLAGYTYMNPVSLRFNEAQDTLVNTAKDNILKYRYRHIAKFDAEWQYKQVAFGVSMRYNSFMQNIDKVFETLLPGVRSYRELNNHGDIIFDTRLLWQLSNVARIALIGNNIFNREYSSRPADIQPPRNFALQVQLKF